MTDYTKLPREELIKEIEVWRDRCGDQQLVYVDDLKIYVDEEINKIRKYYEECAERCISVACEYTDKLQPELRNSSFGDYSKHKQEIARHVHVMNCPPTTPNIKSSILKFLGIKS